MLQGQDGTREFKLPAIFSLCSLEGREVLPRFVRDLIASLCTSTGKLEKSQSVSVHFIEAC